jgi:hypothetical protein
MTVMTTKTVGNGKGMFCWIAALISSARNDRGNAAIYIIMLFATIFIVLS